MDNTNTTENTDNLQKNVGKIDPSVLNTPAVQEAPPTNKIKNTREAETYLELNKPRMTNTPGSDVILDLDGKKLPVGDQVLQQNDNSTQAIQKILDKDVQPANTGSTTSVLLIIAIFAVLVVFIALSAKRNEQILRMEKEIEDLKRKKKYLYD